ncbi:MAG: DNA-directed RNA polymerase subunit beta' [Chitinophagaceae bacterium]|jgi:DNA-directed RNA polymerase subunit beta'|nr:DNA-directed RNA polymerase subunit beta' [Chitinophagaceae bacterium]MBP6986794.1 DNA-directed RNA polymerase subunit beta' [Ferruginibacter sp.]NMD29458.1 DNA-directed RNA polymerase subunit beta' [Bacteroidota bacterium]MBK7089528.1 DNA-directed RNA polymerase subunit beta' [Chitinophagaceae bacterium]MBK7347254.1 DNA-directed RNA polymerase subunit beta' [Chitinophagaceae bacterium]
MAFKKENRQKQTFSKITIGLASPDTILERSYGEVLKPETINYRTYKPERDGLFCERIFGPVKDFECACGKYKRIRYKGIVCDRCGVEVTEKKVRRERMGHIKLVVPVVHIWYFKSLPNKIGYLLGMSSKKLETIIYYERFVVIQPGMRADKGQNYGDLLTEEEYLDILDALPKENQMMPDEDPDKFVAKMGAEAVHALLERLDLDQLSFDLRTAAANETSQQRKADALKRLSVVESFREANSKINNRPEWMVMQYIPVIPPELRPLVPLDGGRFASSDLNDLYRRVIIRNNRLKRLLEIKAPEVILRNEKRMLQEAIDSLFDNSRKSNAVKAEGGRALKSLSDVLKGKQGRFRQNLLGKRVDYSGRSVIVVGPELKMHECGLPKDMAAELFKPFIIRKLIERGIVKTVKSARKLVDKKEAIIWDILENILKGHPVMLNRAPTLHRLSIQAFQPKLIEGKAIQLHPLVTTAFNADFDGDQMAVHVPLSNSAILEAQLLMLSSHNILNPQNGTPITLPSQDMVLGLYYITKGKKSTPEEKVKGEGKVFYNADEVIIAYNEKQIDLHANIKVKANWRNSDGTLTYKLIETTVGRVIFNQFVPKEVGFVNALLTKKNLREIIGDIIKWTSVPVTAKFLDDIKTLGYRMAFRGGLSFNINDLIIPQVKADLIANAQSEVAEVWESYNMGLITNNERYNQIIDIWSRVDTKVTETLIRELSADKQGFNSVFMMLDSGARGSKQQIKQLAGLRGLMAKPRKSGSSGSEIIENPILANFKDGLSVLEYFISTHGARKGLADTALKTADAGYLTRRLVDVAQDVVINEEDCGTLRGIAISALKDNEDIIEPLSDRIEGRTSLHDVYHPVTDELIINGGEEIDTETAHKIEESGIETVEIRSVLTCESKRGVCVNCYGKNLASGILAQRGDAVGIIAAQSIGEPGTQLTLRTFHVGGVAGSASVESSLYSKFDGTLQFDGLRTVATEAVDGKKIQVVIGRTGEIRCIDVKSDRLLNSMHIPYGSVLIVKDGQKINKADVICTWDPFNNVIVAESNGIIKFDSVIEGITYRDEADEQTGHREKVVIETKDKTKLPAIVVEGKDKKSYNLPVGSHIVVEEADDVRSGQVLVKIPRILSKLKDITGGLPRVTELFEARNPSNPAVVCEIDGVVTFGAIKRGNREIIVEAKDGVIRKYLVPLSRQILVQDGDFVKAGSPLSDGQISPADILAIKGPFAVQEYVVNEIQEVYRLQGVKINDKHIEVIVRQMMRKVTIEDAGDTKFLEGDTEDKMDFNTENDYIFDKKVVTDQGESAKLKTGQIVSVRELREENSTLRRADKKLAEFRDAKPATSSPLLLGITKASLGTHSWISAASFQETTKVLSSAAIQGKTDDMLGLKENVITGHHIPAGTGLKEFENMIVGSKEEYELLMTTKEVMSFDEEE